MNNVAIIRRARLGTALAAAALALGTLGASAPAVAQPTSARPAETVNLSKGTGTLVRLSEPMSDVFVANDAVADVQVRSSTQLYVFGKGQGETTIYATSKGGRVVYAANVRVGNNISSVGEMLHLAMPDASIQATPMNNLVLLTGTVANPDDVAEAQRLTQAYVGDGTQVISRVKSATPLQVMLKVRIAEINRSLLKSMGVNLLSHDTTSGFQFGIGRGTPGTISGNTATFNVNPTGTTLAGFGHLLGLDILGTLDIAATDGLATTLAEPTLTALSGETASFLAGGEFPIPISQASGTSSAVTIEYKQYGVGLAFTPIVLGDGRISMRVRPEVSQLDPSSGVSLGGYSVPGLITRRAETTVELGSGQSFMIAGLLQNTGSNSVDKTPVLGDLPILGALFRSTQFQRKETELVVVVTPYLVRPVSGQLATPLDGYRSPNDIQRDWGGQTFTGVSGHLDPTAVVAPAGPAPAPAMSGGSAAPGFKM
ncbi:MAG TPA: type II and III secretion system protein family protein [Sphingomicrobium sp.]|nr:type II and III secretion system protein family protein [Sphingomicrobium sp.]